jgi:GTP-binding protein
VDLPGYGYARGGPGAHEQFDELAQAYFGRNARESLTARAQMSALLVLDSRHPGLQSDLGAWTWLKDVVDERALVATKIDKLARGERIRALREIESVFEDSVVPVSATTGEGLDELWKLIDRLANRNPRRKPNTLPRGMALRRPKR